MKAKHQHSIELHLAEAEKSASAISTKHGRAWKAAYEQARREHTVIKAIEIADQQTKEVK